MASNGALSTGEAAIMDLYDMGVRDRREIAERTGYGVVYVGDVIGRYGFSEQSLSSFDRMSRAGSAALLAAIRKFHPEILTAGSAAK